MDDWKTSAPPPDLSSKISLTQVKQNYLIVAVQHAHTQAMTIHAKCWAVIELGPPLVPRLTYVARREFDGDELSGIGWRSRGVLTTRARAQVRAARAARLVRLSQQGLI